MLTVSTSAFNPLTCHPIDYLTDNRSNLEDANFVSTSFQLLLEKKILLQNSSINLCAKNDVGLVELIQVQKFTVQLV